MCQLDLSYVIRHSPPPPTLPYTNSSDYDRLDAKLADPSMRLSRDQLPLIRLACLSRLVELITQAFDLFLTGGGERCVCAVLFASVQRALQSVSARGEARLPEELATRMRQLHSALSSVDLSATAPPQPLLASTRLTVLSEGDARTLKKFGLLPQLEPRFDER